MDYIGWRKFNEGFPMKTRIFLLLFFAWFVVPANADDLQACPVGYLFPAREQPNERVRLIYVEIIKKAGLSPNDFGACESDNPGPKTYIVKTTDERYVYALTLPPYVMSFSDAELQGVIAHEVAHIAVLNSWWHVSETEVDYVAARWVGVDALINMFGAMERELDRFPKRDQPVLRDEIATRIRALQNAR